MAWYPRRLIWHNLLDYEVIPPPSPVSDILDQMSKILVAVLNEIGLHCTGQNGKVQGESLLSEFRAVSILGHWALSSYVTGSQTVEVGVKKVGSHLSHE